MSEKEHNTLHPFKVCNQPTHQMYEIEHILKSEFAQYLKP